MVCKAAAELSSYYFFPYHIVKREQSLAAKQPKDRSFVEMPYRIACGFCSDSLILGAVLAFGAGGRRGLGQICEFPACGRTAGGGARKEAACGGSILFSLRHRTSSDTYSLFFCHSLLAFKLA
jgi:hypothetical protein